jgi:hypothetical protein
VSGPDHPSSGDDLELDVELPPRTGRQGTMAPPEAPPASAAQRGAAPQRARPAPRIHAIPALPERRSILKPLIFVALIGVGGYGGYFGYCRYKVGERTHGFSQLAQDLHQALMRTQKTVGPEEVRQVVLEMARTSRIDVSPEEITVTIEPASDEAMKKLPALAQTALGIVAKVPGTQRPPWIVGFKGRFVVRHGIVKQVFEPERYTWFEYARP